MPAPAGALNSKASGSSSSCANSYLDADLDVAESAAADHSMQVLSCTAEAIEAALTKAFHITGRVWAVQAACCQLAVCSLARSTGLIVLACVV